MASPVKAFADALLSALSRVKAEAYFIDRAVWGSVVEAMPQRRGVLRLSGDGVVVEVSRFDSLYGYLRLRSGGCLVEGVLEYRQWGFEFRPQRVEGDCRAGGEPAGIEPRVEE